MITYSLGAPPVLQFTDNTGNWVPYGKVLTLDWNTRQPKPTFYDAGGVSARPNPFPLDSVGRAFEVYWEDDTAYYLELQDQQGHRIWSTAYPYLPSAGGGSVVTNNIDVTNLFVNGQMRFFPVGNYAPIPVGTTLIADGGWEFTKAGTNLADSLTFVRFTPDNTEAEASPTYYLNYVSLGAGVGETQKDFTFRFQDVRTCANENVTASLGLMSALAGTYPVEVFATQYFGTGGAPSADVVTTIATFTPTMTLQQFTGTVNLPNLIGKTIGTNGDDALFITFRMPLNTDANLLMTNFYFKIGQAAAVYPYESYEEVDATLKALALPDANSTTYFPNPVLSGFTTEQAYDVITLVPKDRLLIQEWLPAVPTGSLSLWPSDIIPDGYVAAAGQVLIRAGQYNRLFNVPFSSGTFGTAYGSVPNTVVGTYPWSSNIDQFWLLAPTPGTPLAPWNAGDTGFTIVNSSVGVSPETVNGGFPAANIFEITNQTNGDTVIPVSTNAAVTLNIISVGTPTTPAQWECTMPAVSSIVGGTYITWNTAYPAQPDFYIYFVKDGVGTDPGLVGRIGHPCNIESSMTQAELTRVTLYAVARAQSAYFTALPASALSPGMSFSVSTTTATYQIYIQIDGSVTLPVSVTGQLVPLSILSTDTAAQVAQKAAAVFQPLLFKMPDWRGYFPRFTDNGAGRDPDAATRTNRGDGVTGDNPGTYQGESIQTNAPFWVNQAGGIALNPEVGASQDFDVANLGNETRPINVYFTAIVKY